MKTLRHFVKALPAVFLLAGCTAIDEVPTQELLTSPSLLTRSTVTFDSDIYYHEGTGLVLQSYNLFDDPQVYKLEEVVDGITHFGVKFYPKDIDQQRLLSNSDVANVVYIPFGFSPVVPNDQEWVKDPTSLPKYPGISPYVIDTKDYQSTGANTKLSGDIQLPIMYALWPVNEPLPEGIENEICFKAAMNRDSSPTLTRANGYNYEYEYQAQFRSYDSLLGSYVPMRKLKVGLIYGIYSGYSYTNSNGNVTLLPYIVGLSEIYYESLNVVVTLESPDWTIVRNEDTTPVHYIVGTTGSLWTTHTGGGTYVCNLNSTTTEYEIHRAVDYYFNSTHTLSQGIQSSERGTVYHAMDNDNGSIWGETWYSSTTDPFINIYNGHPSQNEVIGTTLHEIGHARMLKNKGYNGYVSCSKTYRESYATFTGWYLGNDYYISKGFVFPYSGYTINSNNRQTWIPGSGDWYTPFFVDLNDDYNQANLNDPISGAPANLLDYAAMTYTSLTDVGTYLYTFAPALFTSAQLTNYLTFFSGM